MLSDNTCEGEILDLAAYLMQIDLEPTHLDASDDVISIEVDGDNVIAALEFRDRVCGSELYSLGRLATVMQKPFPVLRYLNLNYCGRTPPSWEDLPNVYSQPAWCAFHFQHFQNFICLRETFSVSGFSVHHL